MTSDDDGLIEQTRSKILEGALRAIGRLGPRRLTMYDVAHFAEVSRGTVYRYFPSRDELLLGIVEYEGERFERLVNDRLGDLDAGAPRLLALIAFVPEYMDDHPALGQLLRADPKYVIDFLWKHMDTFRRVTLLTSAPLFAELGLVRRGLTSEAALNELLLRLLVSYFLLPSDGREESLEALDVVLRSVHESDEADSTRRS